MKGQRECPGYEPSMFDVLLGQRIEQSGGVIKYAASIDVSPSTLWRWKEREISPFHGYLSQAKERLLDDLGMAVEDLQRLSQITVREGCELILSQPPNDVVNAQHKATHDTVTE